MIWIFKPERLRKRPVKQLSKEEEDEEFFLKKEWANFMAQQHSNQMQQIKRALKSQEVALKELKKDNLELYNKAIQVMKWTGVFLSCCVGLFVD